MRLQVTVVPGAKRNEIVRGVDGGWRVRVAAPAREGRANKELLRFLAERLGVPPSHLRLRSGHASRQKVVEVEGLSDEEVLRRLDTESRVRED